MNLQLKEQQEILEIAEVRNPIYFNYIKDFVNGELEQLPSAESDYNENVPEISGHLLNMSKKSCCVAGELNGWKNPYVHKDAQLEGYFETCSVCERLGIELWRTSVELDDSETDEQCSPSVQCFLLNLKELYQHLGYMQ